MIEHAFHFLSGGCGERDAALALLSQYPVIGHFLAAWLVRFRAWRKR